MTTTLVHPWTSRRIAAGFTQEALADRLGITRHMVIRLEQALFAEPPPAILVQLIKLYDFPDENLTEEYHKYQRDSRLAFAKQFSNFTLLRDYCGELHPLAYWRETQGLSNVGLAKGLCVHQGLLLDYEKNKVRRLPADFYFACNFIEWSTAPLTSAVAAWRIKWH